jgi:hypothetical protein
MLTHGAVVRGEMLHLDTMIKRATKYGLRQPLHDFNYLIEFGCVLKCCSSSGLYFHGEKISF